MKKAKQSKTDLRYSEVRGYNLGLARELGLTTACVYNQLAFWQTRMGEGRWFYKSYRDLVSELPFGRATLQRCLEKLVEAGYIETKIKKANGAPTMHFLIYGIQQIHLLKMSKSLDMVKMSKSNNNKETIKKKTSKKNSSKASNSVPLTELDKLYRLYLRRFIAEKITDIDKLTEKEIIDKASRKYKLTDTRKDMLKRRIKDAGFDMVAAAIVGYSMDSFYTGDNDRGWKADLTFICRSYEKVEEGANKYTELKNKKSNDPWSN